MNYTSEVTAFETEDRKGYELLMDKQSPNKDCYALLVDGFMHKNMTIGEVCAWIETSLYK